MFAPFGRLALAQPETEAAEAAETGSKNIPADAGAELKTKREIAALKAQLEKAVAAEDFEKAIELRDKIRGLEQKVSALFLGGASRPAQGSLSKKPRRDSRPQARKKSNRFFWRHVRQKKHFARSERADAARLCAERSEAFSSTKAYDLCRRSQGGALSPASV
jgi:hypothetical protein